MNLESLLITLVIGAIAGWLAGTLMKGSGFGLIANIVIGIVGAFVGGYVLGMLGVSLGGGMIAAIINATIGAIILLFIIGVVKKEISPDGKVFVHGELWNATATVQIEEGTKVKVVKVNNLVLEVAPVT